MNGSNNMCCKMLGLVVYLVIQEASVGGLIRGSQMRLPAGFLIWVMMMVMVATKHTRLSTQTTLRGLTLDADKNMSGRVAVACLLWVVKSCSFARQQGSF